MILHLQALGDTIKDYTVQGQLGRGSFGVVYKVKDKHGRLCALKKIIEDEDPRKQKYREGEINVIKKELKHDNVVVVYEYFVHQGIIYIAMELCSEDLNDYFIKNLPHIEERYNFMVDTARAINYLHNQEIIHRDIKPENVLLKHNGHWFVCKITDFGIAKIKTKRDETFHTQIGSFAFVAPEIQDGTEYSNSVDVFALGLLYFSIVNCTVLTNFLGDKSLTPGEVNDKGSIVFLNGKLRKDRPSKQTFLTSYFQDCNTEVGTLIYSMLNQNPEDRPQMETVLIKIVQEQVRFESQEVISEKETQLTQIQSQLHQKNDQLRQIQSQIQQKDALNKSLQTENRRLVDNNKQLQSQAQSLADNKIKLEEQVTELEQRLSAVEIKSAAKPIQSVKPRQQVNRYYYSGIHTP